MKSHIDTFHFDNALQKEYVDFTKSRDSSTNWIIGNLILLVIGISGIITNTGNNLIELAIITVFFNNVINHFNYVKKNLYQSY